MQERKITKIDIITRPEKFFAQIFSFGADKKIIFLNIGERGYNAGLFTDGGNFLNNKEFETANALNLNHHGI